MDNPAKNCEKISEKKFSSPKKFLKKNREFFSKNSSIS